MNYGGMYQQQPQQQMVYNPYMQQQIPYQQQVMAQQQARLQQLESMQQPQQMPQPQLKTDMVNGMQGALNYVIQPNTSIPLWDTQEDIMYLKSMDSNGNVSIKKFSITLTEINENQPLAPQIDTTKFATVEEVNAIKEQLNKLSNELGVGISAPKENQTLDNKKTTKTGKGEN